MSQILIFIYEDGEKIKHCQSRCDVCWQKIINTKFLVPEKQRIWKFRGPVDEIHDRFPNFGFSTIVWLNSLFYFIFIFPRSFDENCDFLYRDYLTKFTIYRFFFFRDGLTKLKIFPCYWLSKLCDFFQWPFFEIRDVFPRRFHESRRFFFSWPARVKS